MTGSSTASTHSVIFNVLFPVRHRFSVIFNADRPATRQFSVLADACDQHLMIVIDNGGTRGYNSDRGE